jgi:hypothetical protein
VNELLAAHEHTTSNRAELEASKTCGCCYCLEIFSPDEVTTFTGLDMSAFENPDTMSAETAVCPRCGSEALLGDKSGFAITPQFLGRMHQAWFQATILRKPVAKK